MPTAFAEKLRLALRALSLTRAALAAELGMDKSIVGRWAAGSVSPSAHSLSRITALVARRVEGFSTIDWDRSLTGLAAALGVDPELVGAGAAVPTAVGPRIHLIDEIAATTARRGQAYEGFFETTRPYAQRPGQFIRDQLLIRKDAEGLLEFRMGTGGVLVSGWVLPLQNQLFVVGAEFTSGAMAFGIFHGVSTVQAGALDGLILSCALDAGRTPTASVVVLERIGDLSGDRQADDERFAALAARDPILPPGAVPPSMVDHLLREIGPAQLALGGDLLLRLPLARSIAEGRG